MLVVGEHDLVFTLDFPSTETALAASVAMHMLTGISFTFLTWYAIVDDF